PRLLVNDLPPRFPARARAAVVDARHEVAALREHLIPEVVLPAPVVGHRLRTRAPVDIEEDGMARRGVEIRRLNEGGVELDAGADIDLPELRRAEPQPRAFRLERRVVP